MLHVFISPTYTAGRKPGYKWSLFSRMPVIMTTVDARPRYTVNLPIVSLCFNTHPGVSDICVHSC